MSSIFTHGYYLQMFFYITGVIFFHNSAIAINFKSVGMFIKGIGYCCLYTENGVHLLNSIAVLVERCNGGL